MKYQGQRNIREYNMQVSNIASKLKTLKLELSDDLLVHLVLLSLLAQFILCARRRKVEERKV